MNRLVIIGGALLLSASLVFGQKQPKPKSQKEVEAIQAVFNAQDPDARIAAVEALLSKYADTEFKAIALQAAAMSAQQKNDYEQTIIYSERTLEADAHNYPAMMMIATTLAQKTREFDLDKEEKLGRAEKMAKQGIELAAVAVKPRPDIPDDQWEMAKKDSMSDGHTALGMCAMTRKKYDLATTEFKQALDLAPQPDGALLVRSAAAYNEANKPDDALALLDKVNALPNVHPAVKQVAANERVKATRMKGGAAPAAGKPAPAATPAPAGAPVPVPSPAPEPKN